MFTADVKLLQWNGWCRRYSTFNVSCLPSITSYGMYPACTLTKVWVYDDYSWNCTVSYIWLLIIFSWKFSAVFIVVALTTYGMVAGKIRFYLKAAEADAEVEKKANYLAVLALSDHEQLCFWPSTVAAAIVILASIETRAHTSFRRVIEVWILTSSKF